MLEQMLTFFVASVLLGLAPGPDNIFVLTQAMLNGWRAGVLVTLGLMTGLLFHTAAVALGVAALLKASPLAFSILKILGATYLLYLAWQAFHALANPLSLQNQPRLTARALYLRGIVMNVTNPKVSIFFLAFLPQFVQPEYGAVTGQIMLLGGLFILASLLVFNGIALLAGSIGHHLQQSPHIQKGIHAVAGSIFILLAVKLLIG